MVNFTLTNIKWNIPVIYHFKFKFTIYHDIPFQQILLLTCSIRLKLFYKLGGFILFEFKYCIPMPFIMIIRLNGGLGNYS